MTAHQLIRNLNSRGIALAANSSTLTYSAPAGVLTDADREAMRDNRLALLAIVTGQIVATTTPGIGWHPAGGVCVLNPTPVDEIRAALASERERDACGDGVNNRGEVAA
jgi:hypothetical protein